MCRNGKPQRETRAGAGTRRRFLGVKPSGGRPQCQSRIVRSARVAVPPPSGFWAIYLPGGSDRIYFANEYIQYPNCTGKQFTLTIGTCGGTRDGFANWGTSVNYVVP